MDNLISETNGRLLEIIDNLTTIKEEYETKLNANNKEIDTQLEKVQKYKADFFESKAKIEKMNSDIEGFESDYKKLVERFKDDELANILIAANKEISLKIDERKRKIVKDKSAMNELVDKAENVKQKLVKLTAEKKALELCLSKILDAFEFYSRSLNQIINYSNDNKDNLCACFHEGTSIINPEIRNIGSSFIGDTNFDDEEFNDNDGTGKTYSSDSIVDLEDDPLSNIEDEEFGDLEPVDLSDMIKVDEENSEISDYDNENVIEGNEHKIVINDENINTEYIKASDEDSLEEEKKENNKNKKKKNKKEVDNDISIDVNFDDSLEDDDSLYE